MKIRIETSTSYRGRNARPNWPVLIAFITLALAAGALGAIFSPGASARAGAWYAALSKPAWAPPHRWYGPVWTTLYLLMGIAVWLVWGERYHRKRAAALLAYSIQLVLNALWAPLFFGTRNIGAGLFIMVALWLTIIWTIREFRSVRPLAAGLLTPYVLWVTLATALNLRIWRLNP